MILDQLTSNEKYQQSIYHDDDGKGPDNQNFVLVSREPNCINRLNDVVADDRLKSGHSDHRKRNLVVSLEQVEQEWVYIGNPNDER